MPNFPRDHRPGLFWSSVRSTRENEPLLHPVRRNDNGYAIAESAQRFGQRLCAVLVLGDRKFEVGLDTTGELSSHWNRAHTTLSVVQKRRLGLIDTIWSSDPPRPTRIEGWDFALARIAELAKLAVIAGNCDHPSEFAGWYGPELWGTSVEFDRPNLFADRSQLPQTAVLHLQPPPFASQHATLQQMQAAALAAIDEVLPEARKVAAAARRARRRIRRTSRKSRAQLVSSPGAAAGNKRTDRDNPPAYFGPNSGRYLTERAAFVARYEHARKTFRTNRNVRFPAGTVRFRKLGARCRPCPQYMPPQLLTLPPP